MLGIALLILPMSAAPASAQGSVADTLSFLLTTQSVPTGDFVKDEQSAEVTRDKIYAIPELENFLGDRLLVGR